MDSEYSDTDKPQTSSLSLTRADNGEQYDIAPETLIGREFECTIALNSPHVSRYHAKIIVGLDGTTIEDLNSSNGTFVNGRRIEGPTVISLGDEIRFDSLRFRLTSKNAGQSDATVVMSKGRVTTIRGAETLQGGSSAMPHEPELRPEEEPDEDSTRMLSIEQINNIAAINKQLQQFADTGSGPRFVAMTAPIRGKVFSLSNEGTENTWRFGRNHDCEICVSAPSVSRHHGTIRKKDNRFYFSAEPNKTLRVNGFDRTEALLKHNDQIQMGPMEFIFRLDEQSQSSNTESDDAHSDHSMRNVFLIGAVGAIILALILGLFLHTTS